MRSTILLLLLWKLLLSMPTLAAPPAGAAALGPRITRLPTQGAELYEGWKYFPGDDAAFAQPGFDDQGWVAVQSVSSQLPTRLQRPGVGWLRLRWQVGPAVARQQLVLFINQAAATEVYLNGQLVQRLGTLSEQPERVRAYAQPSVPVPLPPLVAGPQVLAVRFALPATAFWLPNPSYLPSLLKVQLLAAHNIGQVQQQRYGQLLANAISAGALLLLGLLHVTFFYYSRSQRANLYFALFALSYAVPQVLFYSALPNFGIIELSKVQAWQGLLSFIMMMGSCLWAIWALYALFELPVGWWFWLLVLLQVVALGLWYGIGSTSNWGQTLLVIWFILGFIEPVRLTLRGWRTPRRGVGFVLLGFAGALLALLAAIGLSAYRKYQVEAEPMMVFDNLLWLLVLLSPALGISLYLAHEFALDARLLSQKLTEVEHLSAQTLAQEQEKQALLAAQNETLEQQVTVRTAEIVAQRNGLETTLAELRTTQAQLIQKEKMASLGELTAGIAHEIQNPLNFVNNFSEVSTELLADLQTELHAGHLDEVHALAHDLTQNLLRIKDHGGRASGIVRGMLEHSRAGSGERQPTDVNALCEEYLRLAYHGLRAKDKRFTATLQTALAPQLPLVAAAAGELGRVLLNLLTNAFYAVQQRQQQGHDPAYRPTVRVCTQPLAAAIEVQVHDNGTGIAAEVQPKIFRPFFTTKPSGEGTGLGLSLSYDIITKGHGGTLAVASQPGVGTTFTLRLPLK